MIELTPVDKDEWMPRVRVQVIQTEAEARKIDDQLTNDGILADVPSMHIVAERVPAEWPEGYIVRLAWEPFPIIGWVHAQLRSTNPRTAELSWEIAQRYRGHGYMREAIPRVTAWLIRRRAIQVIDANIYVGDEASQKVALAAGLDQTEVFNPGRRLQRWERRLESSVPPNSG
ncbi:MAG TPA: GNAT family N-acetyltransferase [Candidatus Binatia bacterium]|nr:GNAT family N-acetyltransferase [Candidatus Binatia bacterium]